MKKLLKLCYLLPVGILAIVGVLVVQKSPVANAEGTETQAYENRTIAAMVENSKTDPDLLDLLAEYPDDCPIIELDGGFFTGLEDTKESFYVEILTQDEQGVQWRDDDTATVGEVRAAILDAQE